MRNIFLIILFTFFSLKMFSQNKSDRETYYNLPSVEKKLDFIFLKIFNKQINDFYELEKKNSSFKKYKNENKNLTYIIDSLNKVIDAQNQSINEKKLEYSQLNDDLNLSLEKNKNNEESIRTLKSKIEAELKRVENYNGSLDPSLLDLLKARAINNDLPTSKLSEIIKLNRLIFQAELILSKPINTAQLDKIYNSLDKIRYFHSDWHENKIYSLKILLDNYCKANSELIKDFIYIDEEGLEEHNDFTLDYMFSRRTTFVNYTFLIKELERKIDNINYPDKLNKCN